MLESRRVRAGDRAWPSVAVLASLLGVSMA